MRMIAFCDPVVMRHLRISIALIASTIFTGAACAAPRRRPAAPPASVPAAYRTLYKVLETDLDRFDRYLATRPSKDRPIAFASELSTANGNRGPDLIKPRAIDGVRLELDRLAGLGVKGVTIAVSYPLLLETFPRSEEYLAFYQSVMKECRERGMKVDIEAGVVFSNTPFSPFTYDFSTLTFERWKTELRTFSATILRELAPDYLNLGSEPDTSATLTGLEELNDPDRYVELINFVLAGVDRRKTLIGAGSGTWSTPENVRRLASQTSVDFISLHLYPVWPSALENAAVMAQIATQHGKRVIVDEAWLYKTVRGEGSGPIAATADIFRRDMYSFWSPLDQKFLATLVNFARVEGVEFISPFWSLYYYSYIQYTPALESKSYQEHLELHYPGVLENMIAGRLSPTGARWKALIAAND